ncbi:MAG: hypothetical protein ATN33_03645 [Epulopiscium sp. Nele67-Bin001]|nr:MAG: hypothetical protein BEN18_06380 [Epulopiscium sp. Nuni2H_MBin001]OON90219.1 MAG: hypothetical protein ATN33_03645 [Epulopiscium sp. Nele67-Bin001]
MKLRKFVSFGLASVLSLSLSGFVYASETITVEGYDADKNIIDIEVPYAPETIITLDYVALDLIYALGELDKVVGAAMSSAPSYLAEVLEDTQIVNLGGLKEYDLEEMMSLQPDIIFSSGRTISAYDMLTMIAPTIASSLDYTNYYDSFKEITVRNASILGYADAVDETLAEYDARVEALQEAAEGKTMILGLTTNGGFSTLGNESRASILGTTIGFENLAIDVDATHGNASSYELLVELDPDYIFVIDRDTATNAEGASPAQQLLDNELVHMTQAWQNDNIIYLDPSVWYLAEGGLYAMDIMLADIESAFPELIKETEQLEEVLDEE